MGFGSKWNRASVTLNLVYHTISFFYSHYSLPPVEEAQAAALNNASGQRREMRAIAGKKLEPTGGLFKNGLNLYGVSL